MEGKEGKGNEGREGKGNERRRKQASKHGNKQGRKGNEGWKDIWREGISAKGAEGKKKREKS